MSTRKDARWAIASDGFGAPSYAVGFLLLIAVIFSSHAQLVRAESPLVAFDLSSAIACGDVTPDEFAILNPDERLFEVQLEISSILRRGSEDELLEFVYRMQTRSDDVRIVDYSPKTSLVSDIVGNVGVERKREVTRSLGINANVGMHQYLNGQLSGIASSGSKADSKLQYEVLPPLTPLSTSGTLGRGTGVYFKIRPSQRTSLEGAQPFAVVLRAPCDWRGGLFLVTCRASGVQRGVVAPLNERIHCGGNRFLVALYREGDEQAKAAARDYAVAEAALRRIGHDQQTAIRQHRYPSVAHKVGAIFDLVEPRIPDDWIERLIYSTEPSLESMISQLPQHVQDAARGFLEAKQRVERLSRS